MSPKRRTSEVDSADSPNETPRGRPNPPTSTSQLAPVKRQRVSRACDQCRAARERCDGKQPECYPCISQSRPCTYEVSPKKRGVQTGYIRTLELALGWVLEKVPGSEETLGALLAQEGGQGQRILAGRDPDGADRLQKRWRKSRVHKGIDRILSGGMVDSPGQDGISPFADTSDAEGDPGRACLKQREADSSMVNVPGGPSAPPGTSGQHRPPIPLHDEPPGNERHQHEAPSNRPFRFSSPSSHWVKLPPNHWRLLDIYFSYTHSWLPILEKQDMFQASYLYPEQGLAVDPRDATSAVHCELWAALALASLQDSASSAHVADSASPSPRDIYDVARGLLPSEQGPFQAHHACALVLLSLVCLGQDQLTGAGLLTGSAIRILLDPNTVQPSAQDKTGQKMRLSLMACFFLDTILSVRCSSPPHLRTEDLAGLSVATEGGVDQWEPWTPCEGFGPSHTASRASRSPAFCLSTFNQLYTIAKVVADETSARRRLPSDRQEHDAFAAQLQRAIDPKLPFASFIIAPTCGTASVPTSYVARATYLWAGALADPRSETAPPLLQDTLHQYEQRFGKCGVPSFIYTCISSLTLANEPHFLSGRDQRRVSPEGLMPQYSKRPEERRPSSVPSYHTDISPRTAHEPPSAGGLTQLHTPTNTYSSLDTRSLYGGEHYHRPHAPSARYSSFPTPISGIASYDRPYPNIAPMPQQGSNMQLHLRTDMAAQPGATAPAILTHSGGQPHPPHTLIPPTAFGSGPPDYDALLDDLASIECTDALDVDAQFMTNLGFAPGCDIAEILARDFGPV